jgi:hypothetical protein
LYVITTPFFTLELIIASILVNSLEALPEDVKNNRVIMGSMYEPTCGTPGCFAGLISIVANDIPELKQLYLPNNSYNYLFLPNEQADEKT